MSETAIAPMEDFRTRLKEKLRSDIGTLLPDSALDALVMEAVREEFFKPRTERQNYQDVQKPSWFVEEVAKVAKPYLEEAVKRYVEQHKEEVDKAIAQYLTPQNLTLVAVGAMSIDISFALRQLSNDLQQQRR